MATATLPTFDIHLKLIWNEPGVTPPRCRNPRTVEHVIETNAYIRAITRAELSVAFRIPEEKWDREAGDYFYLDGAFYKPYLPNSGQAEPTIAGSEMFRAERDSTERTYSGALFTHQGNVTAATLDEAIAKAKAQYDHYLIVDGEVWMKDGREPFYTVSDGRRSDWAPARPYINISTYSNTGEWAHFNALEWDQAVEYALSLHGDDEDAKQATRRRLDNETRRIEVLMPEAVTLTFDRAKALGVETLDQYAIKAQGDYEGALKDASEIFDASAVGRGEVSYREFLEVSLRHLIDVHEPRLRALEAERGW